MDIERALETQRLRLLRMVAGLVVLVGFLSAHPVSRGFSIWTCRFVGSILSRAEAAARYLVIAQARMMDARNGIDVSFSESLALVTDDADVSPTEYQRRLKALRAILMDLPRHALRLLRRIEKQSRVDTHQPSPYPDTRLSTSCHDWRLAGNRIDRPPDHSHPASQLT